MPRYSSNTHTFLSYLTFQYNINIMNRPINRSERTIDLNRYKNPENRKTDNKNPYSRTTTGLMNWNDSTYLYDDDYDLDSDSDDEYVFDIILNDEY